MIFANENNKNKFYVQAKQAYGNNPNKKDELVEFFKTCDQAKVIPMPIFVKIQDG